MPITCKTLTAGPGGPSAEHYTLVNTNGLEASILTYGGTLNTLRVPDRAGHLADIVLGFDTLAPYLAGHPYFGSLIGRYANRIRDGRFTLDGQTYSLPCNHGPHHLHGGPGGFHTATWAAQPLDAPDGPSLTLAYRSPDGEESYPGSLSVIVTYTLTDTDTLRIDYGASADQATVLNLTNHTYFNLAGTGTILDHELELAASTYLPIDDTFIPVGETWPVAGTPMDFTTPTPIGARIADDDGQLRIAGGYDHVFVLDKRPGKLGLAGRLHHPASGRTMEIYTTQPGVQLYTGNQLDGSLVGKGGWSYGKYAALCLETQHFPDSPNQPQFPSTVLRPGERYRHTTVYRFLAR